jgi:hypothetical protein
VRTGSRIVTTLLLCCSLSSSAHADETAESAAEAAIAEGVQFRREGKDDEALAAFMKAHALKPTPRARAQMALAEQALGRWVIAAAHLEEALAVKDDPWIEKNRDTLGEALRTIRTHTGRLDVRGNVDGATVSINGAVIGTLPLKEPVWIEIGESTIEVAAAGYRTTSRRVSIRADGIARETVELRPGQTTHDSNTPSVGTTQSPASDATGRTLGWVGVGVGAPLIAAGAVGLAVRAGKVSSYNDDRSCPGLDNATQPAACADLVSSANTLMAFSIITIGAGALAVAGGTYFLLSSSAKPSHSAARVTPSIGPRGIGVMGEF